MNDYFWNLTKEELDNIYYEDCFEKAKYNARFPKKFISKPCLNCKTKESVTRINESYCDTCRKMMALGKIKSPLTP